MILLQKYNFDSYMAEKKISLLIFIAISLKKKWIAWVILIAEQLNKIIHVIITQVYSW